MQVNNSYDVLIAGGGPAGLSAAYAAAKSGARVAVFEKSKEIGYPIHTSGGSWIAELQKLAIPSRLYHPIHEGLLISPNHEALFHYKKPVSCVLDVRALYQYLAEMASQAGAEIFVNTTVRSALLKNGGIAGLQVSFFSKPAAISGEIVVDATGINRSLARQLGLATNFKRRGVGAEYDLYAPDWPEQRAAILFGSHVAPSGYAWIFPRGNGRVRLGAGVISPDSSVAPRECLERILTLPRFHKEFANISRLEYHVGAIPAEKYLPQTVADGFVVVGDAGGLISILLGEGIRQSIDIGRMAGEVIGDAIQKKQRSAQHLAAFSKKWQNVYQRQFDLGTIINQRLAGYTDADWDGKITLLSKMNAQTVAALLKGDLKSLFASILKNDLKNISLERLTRIKSTLNIP